MAVGGKASKRKSIKNMALRLASRVNRNIKYFLFFYLDSTNFMGP